MNVLQSFKSSFSPRLMMLVSFAGTSIINYLFGVATLYLLTPGDYGLLAFVQTILLIGGLLLNSGFAWSLTAEIAQSDASRRAGLVRGAVAANLLFALALSLLFVVLFWLGVLRSGLETWTITLVVAVTLPFLSLLAIANGAVRGAEHFGELAFLRVLEVVCKAVSGIAFILAGYGVVGGVIGFWVGAVIAGLVGAWRVLRRLEMPVFGPLIRPSLRMAGSLFGALLGMALLLNLDILALKLFGSADRSVSGYYQGAIMLANTPYYMTTAMLAVLFPQLARLKEYSGIHRAVRDTLRLILVFLVPLELVMIAVPEAVLKFVFPDDYVSAAQVLRLLAVGNIAILMVAMFSTIFQATGRAKIVAAVLAGMVLVEGVLLAVFVPSGGANAAASLFMLACTLSAICLAGCYWRQFSGMPWAAMMNWSGRYLLSVVVMWFVLVVMMQFTNSILAAGSLAAGCYLALVAVLKTSYLPLPKISRAKKVAAPASGAGD